MLLKDFDYAYPPELTAQTPLEKRDDSQMMVVDRALGNFSHHGFRDLPTFLREGDVLVFNDSKVLPCRLVNQRLGGGRVEFLLLREREEGLWECLVSPSKKIKKNFQAQWDDDLKATVVDEEGSPRLVRLESKLPLVEALEKWGQVPLPPYIKRPKTQESDLARYQTVYAAAPGSAAAPTAGFHFTQEVLEGLKAQGVIMAFVTLHVGLGTFWPIRTQRIQDHRMHGEIFHIPSDTKKIIEAAKKENRRVIAVGTTSVRALESAAFLEEGVKLKEGFGYTEKFIYPPYSFQVIEGLFTNFHQPQSSLLVLVSAFAGVELIRKAYEEAVQKKYRLFSYGDCMLIV